MKKFSVLTFATILLGTTCVNAQVVIKPTNDNIGGKVYGGLSGLMIGGATGGPIGALVGAGLGMFVGENVQNATGLSQRAYLIEENDGRQLVVRSPNYAFTANEQVRHVEDRLLPMN